MGQLFTYIKLQAISVHLNKTCRGYPPLLVVVNVDWLLELRG